MVTYEDIRKVHRMEKSAKELTDIDDAFYKNVREFMNGLKREYVEKLQVSLSEGGPDESVKLLETQRKNANQMLSDIYETRTQKIVDNAFIAARDQDYRSPIDKMCAEEKEFFNKVKLLFGEHKRDVLMVETRQKDKKDEGQKTNGGEVDGKLKVRIMKDLPAIVGVDLETYGPFTENEVVVLPKENAYTLIKHNFAEELN